MIKKVIIKNFKSYKLTKLYLHKGVNVIVPSRENNPNSIGKTNIIRAIHWGVSNRPISSGKILNNLLGGSGSVFVRLFFDNGMITLKKKISNNQVKDAIYSLSVNGEKEQYRKFNKSVPDNISKVANLDEINFSLQLDEPFLITSSNSKISKEINKVTKLDEADEWISTLNSKIRKENNLILNRTDQIKEVKEKIKGYRGLDQIGIALKKLRKIENQIKEIETEEIYLKNSIEQINIYNEEIENLNKFPKINFDVIDKLDKQIEEKEAEMKWINTFMSLVREVKSYKQEYEIAKGKLINQLQQEKICPVCSEPLSREKIENIIKEFE